MSSKTHIVWIDNDADIIDAVVRPLEQAGYHIMRLRSAHEALGAIEQLKAADLILLEPLVPEGRLRSPYRSKYPGKELLRELRTVHHVGTRTLVFTVACNDELYQQLRALGVTDIVRKPTLPSHLKTYVDRTLEISI